MTDTVVDVTMVGTTIVSDGTLTSVTLTKPPQEPSYYFSLIDVDADGNTIDELFTVATWATAWATGQTFPVYDHPFTNLVLKNIAPSAQFTITTTP